MGEYKPIFDISPTVLNLLVGISTKLGEVNVLHSWKITPKLRRENRIKTIHFSLAIEQNTLSLEQVTAILDGKRVLGSPNEIREIQNAGNAYDLMPKLNPLDIDDMLRAHKFMMDGLIKDAGCFRNSSVGVYDGHEVIHVAPLHRVVPQLVGNLIDWYKKSTLPPLIKSAIFHYEFEYIHPFMDGNGRIGRMWHTMLLGQWDELFYWLPVEELIKSRQMEYYSAFNKSNAAVNCTVFIEVMLRIIFDSLKELSTTDQVSDQVSDQVKALLDCLKDDTLSASEIMNRLHLTHKPSFRKHYLNPALECGVIERTIPDKPNSRNQKYRKSAGGVRMS